MPADMGSHRSGSSVGLKVATSAPPMETPQLVSPPDQDSSLQAAPTAPPGELGAHKHHVSLLLIDMTCWWEQLRPKVHPYCSMLQLLQSRLCEPGS